MIYSFLYVFIFSFAMVLIQKLFFSVSPLFSLFITASIATLYFNLINIKNIKKIYSDCWRIKNLWIAIMVTILIMWLCAMIGPGLIGASLYSFLNFSFMGTLGFLSLGIKDWESNRFKLYLGIVLISLELVIVINELYHFSSINIAIGLLLPFIGGACSFIYFKQSQALNKIVKLTATQILAIRFYLTILTLLIILPHQSFTLYFTSHNMAILTLLAFLSLIIPLYFQQKALEKISSEQNAVILSLTPVCTAFIQEAVFKNVNLHYMIIYIIYTMLIACPWILHRKKTNVGK